MPLPIVAIIGRPNVGKSTFFNRVSRTRQAITDDRPGITRDRHYQKVDWNGRLFVAIDTGGFVPHSEELFESKIREQVELAIGESDLVLFMVDAQVGPAEIDTTIAKMLLKLKKPTILVVNKADNDQLDADTHTFFSLGLGEPAPVSSASGRKVAELLDKVVAMLPEAEDEVESDAMRVAVIGRPNVGKSSLVNRLLGIERLIVTDLPGTTRDSIDTELVYDDKRIVLIDTAGLRRAAKLEDNIEFYTSLRSVRAMQRADVAMILVEGPEGITNQDLKIVEQAEEERKGIMIVVNKWDLVEKDPHTADEFTASFHAKAKPFSYIPLVFISALTGQRVTKVLDTALAISVERQRRLSTSELNDFVQDAVKERQPGARGGSYIKFYYATQAEVAPPTFIFFVNHPDYLHKSYLRFLENRLRERFGFEGVALRLKFMKRTSKSSPTH